MNKTPAATTSNKLQVTRAFTIIELLIAIAISTALVGVGVAGYRDFAIRQAIDAGKRLISADLRSAQSRALASARPTTGCTGTFDGYRFRFTSQAGVIVSYSIAAVCNGSDVSPEVIELPTGVTIALVPSSTTSVLFRPLGKGTDLPSGSPLTVNITGNQAVTARVGTIVITSTGEIR